MKQTCGVCKKHRKCKEYTNDRGIDIKLCKECDFLKIKETHAPSIPTTA